MSDTPMKPEDVGSYFAQKHYALVHKLKSEFVPCGRDRNCPNQATTILYDNIDKDRASVPLAVCGGHANEAKKSFPYEFTE